MRRDAPYGSRVVRFLTPGLALTLLGSPVVAPILLLRVKLPFPSLSTKHISRIAHQSRVRRRPPTKAW